LGFSSCQESGQDELKEGLETMLKDQDPVAYENKLKELTLFMGEVFKDPEARRELFDLAKSDEYEEDISYSLKTLLETNQNPNTRQGSAILQAFYKNAENHRLAQEEDFNEQELIHFINENEISMLAPYMIGYFEPESLTELTVSWWTEEMELKSIQEDPNGNGETPGFKISLNGDGNYSQFLSTNDDYLNNQIVYSNDEYAVENPTVVFGSFGDDASLDPGEGDPIGGNIPPPPPLSNSPICDDLNDNGNDIVTVRMPEIQLDGNIRRWPNPNVMFMWVATGSFEVNSNGIPAISKNINHPITNLEIKRKTGRNKDWVSSKSSFIISNWKYDSENAYIVWACTRTRAEIDVEGTVKASKKDGPSGELKVKVAIRNAVELVSAMSYDKCFVLRNNRNQTQQGNLPLRNGNPVYEFSQVRSYFTIEKIQ
jgi:hypothetical protein